MRSLARKTLLAFAAALLPGAAQAQFGGIGTYSPPQMNPYPAYSPYLNMTRPGGVGGAATNYYGIVRPQLNAMRNFNQINQALSSSGMGTGDVGYVDPATGQLLSYFAPNAADLTTGHRFAYFNYSHYYNFQQLRALPGGASGSNLYGAGFGRGGIAAGSPFYSGLTGNSLGGLSTSTPIFFSPGGTTGGIGGIGGFSSPGGIRTPGTTTTIITGP